MWEGMCWTHLIPSRYWSYRGDDEVPTIRIRWKLRLFRVLAFLDLTKVEVSQDTYNRSDSHQSQCKDLGRG